MRNLLIGAAVLAALGSVGTAASAHDYGYWGHGGGYDSRYRDSDRDGRPDRWDRYDNRRDYDRYDNRRDHDRYRDYRHHGPRYGYYDRRGGRDRPYYNDNYSYRYYGR
jgi:hypothetical protein